MSSIGSPPSSGTMPLPANPMAQPLVSAYPGPRPKASTANTWTGVASGVQRTLVVEPTLCDWQGVWLYNDENVYMWKNKGNDSVWCLNGGLGILLVHSGSTYCLLSQRVPDVWAPAVFWERKDYAKPSCTCNPTDLWNYGCPSARGLACRTQQ